MEAYLQGQARMNENVKRALRAGGALDEQEAEGLRARVAGARSNWREGPSSTSAAADKPGRQG